MNRLLALMFEKRGYSSDYYESICQCTHPEPAHIDEMCALLKKYHDEDTQIALLTDFDMDGLMSGVVGYAGMKELGFNVVLAYPDVTTGYGIDAVEIDRIKAQYPKASVLVTGDVGITAYDGVARARELGMDVLVTDHHIPKGKNVDANVIVDPQLADDPAFNGICGAHVLYLVLRHYALRYTDNPDFYCDQIDRLRVFAGFGTISDSMPMLYENRQLVKDALHTCRTIYNDGSMGVVDTIPGCEAYRRAFAGLHTLLSTFVRHKGFDINTIQEDFIGFYAAPTFNSIKRLSGTVETAYKVFFGSRDEANTCMEALMDMNEERKERVESTYAEMCRRPSKYAPFLHIVETTPGLCGLLAQKVRDRSGYPSVVVVKTDKGYRGSGRSPEWYPFLTNANGHPGWEAAGHEGAFGISFDNESALEAFVAFIKADVEKKKPAPEMLEKQPDFVISTLGDGDTDININLFKEFLDELSPFHPFGPGFEAPNIILRFDPQKSCKWSLSDNGKHIQAELRRKLNLVCFNQGHYFEGEIDSTQFGDEIEVAGQLALNTFNGETKVQFIGTLPEDLLEEYLSTPSSEMHSSEDCHEEHEVYRRPIMNHDYKVKGQKRRAWEIQSQCVHNGEDVWTEEIVDRFVKALLAEKTEEGRPTLKRYAWCKHDKDKYREENIKDLMDRGEYSSQQIGEPRPAHIHLMLEFENPVYNTALHRILQKYTPLDIMCIRKPSVRYNQFMAMATYLSHCTEKEYIVNGKYRYPFDEIHCNFDYGEAVNEYLKSRERDNSKKQRNPRIVANDMINRLEKGELTLEEAKREAKENEGYAFFLRYEKEFRLARAEYIKTGYKMQKRINIYIYGKSGSGKSTLSQWLARTLYPDLEDYECFYTVGAKGVRFDDYEYQPVIIWEDIRPEDLLREYKREGILNLLELSPKKRSYNIKFGKVTLTHRVNIFTCPNSFEEFSEYLMGAHNVGNQRIREEVDKEQLSRRFPIIINILENRIEIKRNVRIYDDADKSAWQDYSVIRNVSIAKLNEYFTEDALEIAFNKICGPIVNLYKEYMLLRSDEQKYSEEFFSLDSLQVLEGYKTLTDEDKRPGTFDYHTVCEKLLFEHRISLEECGPYESEEGWSLGDPLTGDYEGCRCPFTFEQWVEMGKPKGWGHWGPDYEDDSEDEVSYENENMEIDREYRDMEEKYKPRRDEVIEYWKARGRGENPDKPEDITDEYLEMVLGEEFTEDESLRIFGIDPNEESEDEPDPDWVSDYVSTLRKATDQFLKTRDTDHLKQWIAALFGDYTYIDIDENETAKEYMIQCWREVRAACIEAKLAKDEKSWYELYQRLNSECASEMEEYE